MYFPECQEVQAARQRVKSLVGDEYSEKLNPAKYFNVNPLEVQFRCPLSYPYKSKPLRNKLSNYGVIKDFDDAVRKLKPVKAYSLYESLKNRFLLGYSWEHCGVLDIKLAEVERAGRAIDGCITKEDFLRRYAALDAIAEEISRNGFKSQVELDGTPKISNEMFVTIGSDGARFFSAGGNHRIALAHLLRINAMPVLVMSRHENYIEYAAELACKRCSYRV